MPMASFEPAIFVGPNILHALNRTTKSNFKMKVDSKGWQGRRRTCTRGDMRKNESRNCVIIKLLLLLASVYNFNHLK
jgi:hypothetical protein